MKFRCSGGDSAGSPRAGVTLAETLVAVAIGALVLATTLAFSLYSSRTMAGIANYTALNSQSTRALDRMTQDIRQAVGVSGFKTNLLVLNDGSNRPPIRFIYSPASKSLVREQGTDRKLLLEDCSLLQFALFQRSSLPGKPDQYYPATPNTCKIVEVKWVCSKKVPGSASNSEEAQMAKIAIRKKL